MPLRYNQAYPRRVGRVAEGGGLLNRYRIKSSIGGSNPPLSASSSSLTVDSRLNPANIRLSARFQALKFAWREAPLMLWKSLT